MREMSIDTAKLPLGLLSKAQLNEAFLALVRALLLSNQAVANCSCISSFFFFFFFLFFFLLFGGGGRRACRT